MWLAIDMLYVIQHGTQLISSHCVNFQLAAMYVKLYVTSASSQIL